MANPWSMAASAEEAAKGAGLDFFGVPQSGTKLSSAPLDGWEFSYMDGMAQAQGSAGAAPITIRKSTETDREMLTGDYTEYAHEWTQNIKGLVVNCAGNEEGRSSRTWWTVGDIGYCILAIAQGDDPTAFGLGADDISSMVNAIQ